GAQVRQSFSLQQPQDKVSVAAGETLTLRCTTSGHAVAGPVRWLKGWGSDNKTIYDQRESPSLHVTRAVPGSDTDFTIHIRNVQPEDMGTYYCVKFSKSGTGGDQVFQHGHGTEVSVHETALVPGMVTAAVVLCFFLLLLLGLFVALCMYRRKHQGRVGSPCLARTVATGSFSSVPLRCCAGTPDTPRFQSSKEENDIHYADLQPLPPAPRHGRSLGTAPTEYASLRVAAK
ncbi:SHPS1 phosphatase, partial [Notiomystis cincta]|nr:SHPS1 phosphatase [Notiomystis cincta]